MYRLNMFSSAFELSSKHADKEDTLSLWADPDTVRRLHRDPQGRPTFLLHDGPPYANGHLHLGHVVNKTLKDAVLKYKRLEGYFAPFVPGFDCHGLPVELEVEKQGARKDDPVAFVQACRAYAESQVAQQSSEFQAFGVSADWQQAYRTMDPAFEAAAARYFYDLPQKVRRLRPVHWCAACGSSLAEAEVEYKAKTSPSLELRFPVEGHAGLYLLVWTTTPYTLPANKAVGYSPRLEYVAVADEDGSRLVRARRPEDDTSLPAFDVSACRVTSPFTGASVPVVPADYVSSAGTGLVHLAPAFGTDDFRVGEQHGLQVEPFLDDRGRFLAGLDGRDGWGSELSGLTLEQAGQLVLEKLQPWVHSCKQLSHEYPHCWRHKKPLFFKASEEWFLDLTDLGPKALQALEAVSFVPGAGRERLAAMVASRSSWCLSRTRLWGTPLLESEADVERMAAVKEQGVAAWHAAGPRRTLDVWFDSGVTHALVLSSRFGTGDGRAPLADLYLEGSDQHRGWFQSSLLTAVAAHGRAPYAQVLTHGFVVDEKGQKYSKSSGNYVPLEQLLKTHSPDVLRLWVLSQDFTRELKMSKESLARTSERYRKLRNTMRFCLQNTADWDFAGRQPTHALDLHQLNETARVQRAMRHAVGRHDFAAAMSELAVFCETTSADYFTAVKDRLYCDAPDSPRRRDAQYVLGRLLDFLVRALAPVLPFTAEEVYQDLRTRRQLAEPCSLLLTWQELEEYEDCAPVSQWRALKAEVNRYVEAQRDEWLKSPAQLELEVTAPCDNDATELADFFGCSAVEVTRGDGWSVRARRTLRPFCPRCRRHDQSATKELCRRCEGVERAASLVLSKTAQCLTS